ncbi:asparagine synthase (glutamine-hydrolyzing) [Rhodopirellula sp. MGV]|uniref:asparagine synthase (glutamine-hydrolyzing) n=1 Tax=Rhodopirellula sp. MGV TaxID=2023130 RepID=UPI000B9715D0|nr:asparagine synthase (glutamine-hydrolyzing) [Rhodopirellula sp. MGV]OYP37893.1 asparagine synthase (glutamine-hydrolyzing) [Rhodopirellula sp. MGV]PNY37070.1 asparagine synthase (glutamine-hydrolyzing) [Rhodopirellula baltica]
MCGITGAVWLDDRKAVDQHLLSKMTDAITHRGPDDDGHWIAPHQVDGQGRAYGIALGFRRLSIIDVAGAAQPLGNEDGGVQIIFNGEIYNYKTLRRRLEGNGHRFQTDGDGETIVHLYEDLATDCFAELNGMFAIALWDRRRSRLVLARDRIGQKPVYYAFDGQRLVFGSELKCLAAVEGVCTELDPAAIDEFLTYQYVPHPGTIWKGVRKLPPGHFLVFEKGNLSVHRYWDFDPTVEKQITRQQAVETLRELLTDSVRYRLQSDVPLGSFLSGGIDSSLITAIAAAQRDEPIRTFSIGFPVADFDETHYAAQVAAHLKTDHKRFEVQPSGAQVIEKLVWHFDEPFGDSSAVPTWYLSELTRREVTVALSGDGGDELFAGYERYRALWLSVRLRRMFPIHRMPGIGLVQRLPDSNKQYSIMRRAKRFFEALEQPEARRYLNWLQIFPERMRAELYTDDFVEQLPGEDPFEFLDSVWQRSDGRDVVSRASISDLLSYLPCDLCTKVDVASMAHSLEVRQPMLDHRVVEFAASLPVDLKFRGRRGKLLLEDAFGDMIPRSIFHRRKMGFGIPIGQWFRDELKPMVHETLLGPDARIAPYFRREVVEKLVGQHERMENNHGYRLWNLLILEQWLRQWN